MEKKYQIFISSTYIDLIDARTKVRDAILTMMHFPIGREMFSAADEDQWEIIRNTIDSSDYYILIVGQKYGSVIETGDETGISYTEKEFRYAKKKGIPILAFILSDDANIKKADFESDVKKTQKLNEFKIDVKTGRIVEWWKTPDELAYKVTAALHKQIDRKKRSGWVRGDSFDIEASHEEILNLNKLVRELQEENANLKLKIIDRVPKLNFTFVLDSVFDTNTQNDLDKDEKSIEDECRSHSDLVLLLHENNIQIKLPLISVDYNRKRYNPLSRSCVKSHLESYVSDRALHEYNKALPSSEIVEAYIENLKDFQRIRKGGIAFKLKISNNGTAKATDIRVFIDFPKEFLLFKISDIKDIKEPKAPELPENPIEKAEEEYSKKIYPLFALSNQYNEYLNQFNFSTDLGSANFQAIAKLKDFHLDAINHSLFVKSHSIVVETQQIPHKDFNLFGSIYIVPTIKGNFQIKVSLMCSEYLEPIENYINIEIV